MSAATNFLEDALLNHLRGTSYTMPAGLFVKLHIGDPGEDAAANPAANAVRQAVTFGASAAGTITATGTPVAEWTSVSSTETYSHFSIWDTVGPSGGNPLIKGALSSSAAVTAGDNFQLTSLTTSMD